MVDVFQVDFVLAASLAANDSQATGNSPFLATVTQKSWIAKTPMQKLLPIGFSGLTTAKSKRRKSFKQVNAALLHIKTKR